MAGTVLLDFWLATYQRKKIVENCNSARAGAQYVEKVFSFWPNFDTNFTNIGERKKVKLYTLKKVGLKNYLYNSSVMFLTYFYLAWNVTLRP